MPIANVILAGRHLLAFDERGRRLFRQRAGSRPGDGLEELTAGALAIRRGGFVFRYDHKGRTVSVVQAHARPSLPSTR